MGKYTERGSADFDSIVDAHLEHITATVDASLPPNHLHGMVLLGGYGRSEGTPLKQNGQEVPFNDYDLVVVAQSMSRQQRGHIQEHLHDVGHRLSAELGVDVDLYVHTPTSLQHCEPSLLNYEMLHGHRVVNGPRDLLKMMPRYSLADIPMEEGTRLLLNRGKLLLDIKCALESGEPLSDKRVEIFKKFLWKNYLAFGDCVLLARRDYDVRYKQKVARIRSLAGDKQIPDGRWMVEKYLQAVEFKHEGDYALLEIDDLEAAFEETLNYFLRFFLWYEGTRMGCELITVGAYCAHLTRKKYDARERIEFLIKNLRYLKLGAFNPSWRWALIHPRNRLFAALWLLLSPAGHTSVDHRLLRKLLNTQGDHSSIVHHFLTLRMRLS